MFKKYFTPSLLIVSLSLVLLLPIPTKKAEAVFGFSIVFDPVHNASTVYQTVLTIADMVARAAAQAILQRMIDSTVAWANSGFEGNPAYVTNPRQFFTNIADGVAGELIAGSDLDFLCSPFQTQVRLALLSGHTGAPQFECTLSEVVGNIEGFYGDFNQGGWDGWLAMTQNNANNPYGAFIEAQVELDQRIAKTLSIETQQLEWNQGFLSWSECLEGGTNPDTGECIPDMRAPVKTPGSIIKSQLDQVLPSTMNRFINAQHLEDLIAAFVTGALNRFVFSSEDGLFTGNLEPLPLPEIPPPGEEGGGTVDIDLDGDGIVDGADTDGDGQVDICYYGGTSGAPTPPCVGSSSVESSGGGDGGGDGGGGGDTHAECQPDSNPAESDFSCVTVSGPGSNECSVDADCN